MKNEEERRKNKNPLSLRATEGSVAINAGSGLWPEPKHLSFSKFKTSFAGTGL